MSSSLFSPKRLGNKPFILAIATTGILVSSMAFADDIAQFSVTVSDTSCQPMTLKVPAGKVQFTIKNNSMRALEWEILDGVMVVAERENIAPGFKQKMTLTLHPGNYDMTCGLLTNPHGKLVVEGSADSQAYEVTSNDFITPIAEYKFYVMNETRKLTKTTAEFTDAIRANDLEKAKTLYNQARTHYERIEPIAELFADLDKRIDAREDDYAKGVNDADFSGFHRLEYALWQSNSLTNTQAIADKLDKDVNDLQGRIRALPFPPSTVVGGAAALIEEVASSKISGEEDRYAHTDLADFNANIEGAQKIVDLFKPMVEKVDARLQSQIDSQLAEVTKTLKHYQTAQGFEPYNQLTEEDRRHLRGTVTALAEDLSKLRGSLDLD